MLDRIEQLGFLVKQHREQSGWTQEELAARCDGGLNRSTVAHLEQGRRLPDPAALQAIAQALALPEGLWRPFAREESRQRQELESALSELAGQAVSMRMMDLEAIEAAEDQIRVLFSGTLQPQQLRPALNRVLVFYGLGQMSRTFFDRYFSLSSFISVEPFAADVRVFQKEAIRLFATFGEGYRRISSAPDLDELMRPLQPRVDLGEFEQRTHWESPSGTTEGITRIEEHKLAHLGYISVARYREQLHKRHALAGYLRELAAEIRKVGSAAVAAISTKRRRRMDSLLRELDCELQHTPISPLFTPDPAQLEQEANHILRDEEDIERMQQTQSVALKNLSSYVTADVMDVYVATSMRTESDYVSVNRFVTRLFGHPLIAPLHLRYFNPTQSWIDDRVAKGLVEALMLRRAGYTVYMAQKTDTFGKDSEASVALGQGKPVIVVVPKLALAEAGLDSAELYQHSVTALRQAIVKEASPEDHEIDETLTHQSLFAELLMIRLRHLTDAQLTVLVREHWADFALFEESERIRGPEETARREAYSSWLRVLAEGGQPSELDPGLRDDLLGILVATTVNFEKRATTFREVHPLALQVILSSGVLNGILVARSVESCAQLLRALLENRLDLELEADELNYRLKETTTGSTVRVISRNHLLVNAFEAFYRRT